MRQFFRASCSVALIGGIGIGFFGGCGPAKELPDEVPTIKAPEKEREEPAEKIPAQSSPEAKAVVDRAIKAITQNHPELLKKARVSVVKTKGRIKLPTNQPQTMTEAERSVEAVWPDRLRIIYQFKEGGHSKQTWVFHSPFGWFQNQLNDQTAVANTPELARYIRINLMAEHWLLIGLGYEEPGAVVFDASTTKAPNGSTTTVKLSLSERPVYRVSFNDRTGLPVRIEYEPLEMNQKFRVKKAVAVVESKEAEGFMLPLILETYLNDQLGERWTIDSWEFPEKLPDAYFEQPK